MGFFNWEPKYVFGLDSIDNEHKTLVETTDEIYSAMRDGKSKEVIGDVIQKLVNYTKSHFRREEMLLKSIGYENYEKHKAEHEAFVNKVNSYKKMIEEGKTDFVIDTATFLKNWLANHILVTDRKYVDEMKRFNIN